MERKEVYNLIRKYNLGEEVANRFGNNYTRVPTKKLEQVLWDYDSTLVDECPYENEAAAILQKAFADSEEETKKAQEKAPETQEVDNPYEAACYAFVGILKDSGLLDEILATLK